MMTSVAVMKAPRKALERKYYVIFQLEWKFIGLSYSYYGEEPTMYHASVENPSGVNVKVTPAELKFVKTGEKITFRIDFFPFKNSDGSFVFGALIWNNGIQRVRSPIGLNVLST